MFFLFFAPIWAEAATDMEVLLPPVSCGVGWNFEGKPSFYDKETLSDLIDGEAELYFPYGFDRLVYGRYASHKRAGAGMDVNIFRMGSLLDAFGIYANYRQKESKLLSVGTEATLSGSQLFMYQGRYFVQVQVTGTDVNDPKSLVDCALSVAARLPEDKYRPPELSVFDRPEVTRGSERYFPQSLLGYDIFAKGIIADAIVERTNLQLFLLLSLSPDSASATIEKYRSQLSKAATESPVKGMSYLEGIDPLYGQVIMLRKEACLAGAIKFTDRKVVRRFLEKVCR